MTKQKKHQSGNLREEIYRIIFKAERPDEQLFDIILLVLIVGSVVVVMLETVDYIQVRYETLFYVIEWVFTILFTIEYLLRLYAVHKPWKYATSFYGIVDLTSILPTYLSIFFVGGQYLAVIRALRLLRVFRVFKLGHFLKEGTLILDALRASRPKITVFMFSVLLIVIIMGSLMYLIEGGENSGFTSIPRSVYWAVVTLTTVGYGDITPTTSLGQFVSAVVMVIGYAVIAVPTGIVTNEIIKTGAKNNQKTNADLIPVACVECGKDGHDIDARHCKYCGESLP